MFGAYSFMIQSAAASAIDSLRFFNFIETQGYDAYSGYGAWHHLPHRHRQFRRSQRK